METISFKNSVYSALVESHLRYVIPTYGGTFTSTIKPLLRLRRRAIRLVCNARRAQHSQPLFGTTAVSTFIKLYSTCDCSLMEVVARPAHQHKTRFRRNRNLSIPITKTSVSYRSARTNYVKLYNSFPLQVKEAMETATNHKKRRKMLKRYGLSDEELLAVR